MFIQEVHQQFIIEVEDDAGEDVVEGKDFCRQAISTGKDQELSFLDGGGASGMQDGLFSADQEVDHVLMKNDLILKGIMMGLVPADNYRAGFRGVCGCQVLWEVIDHRYSWVCLTRSKFTKLVEG